MNRQEPNTASATKAAEEAQKKVNADGNKCADDFQPTVELDGKTDSGPEPDVFGQEIPPQN